MRPKGYRKVHEVPKNAQTAQMHPKYLMGPKLAWSDQSTDSVQKCREVPKLEKLEFLKRAVSRKYSKMWFWLVQKYRLKKKTSRMKSGYIYVNIWNQYAVHKTILKSLKVNQ